MESTEAVDSVVWEVGSEAHDVNCGWSESDVTHNMAVCVMLDAIFNMGWTDLMMAMTPLLAFLNAPNKVVGLVTGGVQCVGLFGLFVSPFISRCFRRKKYYLLVTHLPYLGVLALIGLSVVFSERLGLTQASLLRTIVVLTAGFWFFAGFVALPHQEYVAACIPMSHRGRYSGFSFSIGGIASIVSSVVGGVVLATVSKPAAFGFLYLMTWFITQSGYLLALLGRECPVPSENVPRAWSGQMVGAALKDKAFMRVMAFMVISTVFISPIFITFVSAYGFKELRMAAALSAIIALIGQVVRIVSCAGIGVLTDRISPKRILPYWMFVAFLALLPVAFIRNAMGVYISTAIAALYLAGTTAACNALIYGIPRPENRSGHYTIQLILQYLATSAGMIVMGWLCDMLAYGTVFTAFAVVSLLMVPVTKRLLSILSDDIKSYA